jgi:hypothetical protein
VVVAAVSAPVAAIYTMKADLATALYCQVPLSVFLLATAAAAITVGPAVLAVLAAAALLSGAVAVAVVLLQPLPNALAAIASTVVMAVRLTPAPLHPYRVVVVVLPVKQQLLAVLAVLAFASFTSGDSYGLRNR